MTAAERMVYERLHGRGSAPQPTPPELDSFEEHRERVETQLQDLEQQQAEIDARRMRVEAERRQIDGLRHDVAEAEHEYQTGNGTRSTATRLGVVSGVQKCVTPWFALKRFFTDWMPEGRSSRSEVWWVILFVQFPMLILERAVGDSDLMILVGIIELILLWPMLCLEGRRFHDIGHRACWGMLLTLLRIGAWAINGVYGGTSDWALLGGIAGFILLLANVAQSQLARNRYGAVPNLSL